ncbi:hypothetical protein H8959_022053 [Pygathrix nigripes]
MVMSQGTYTFLTCFAGFWLIWGLIVLLCCFCSFLRRRLKRRQEERLREQNLRALELEPLELEGSLAGSPPGLAPPQPPPHRSRLEAPAHAHSHPHVHVHPLLHHGPAQPHAHPHSHPHPHHHALPHPPPPHLSVPPRPWSYPRQALCLQADRGRRVFPSWTDSELSSREPLEHGAWRLPVSIPLFGRTTAV